MERQRIHAIPWRVAREPADKPAAGLAGRVRGELSGRGAIRAARCASAALLLVVALAACAGPLAPAATPTPRPTATPASVVLFTADWSHGLAGWNATAGWTVVNGALQSDVGDNRSVTIPYQPTVSDYAVEFQLQIVDIPQDGGYFFLAADRAADRNGYVAGVSNLLIPGVHQAGSHPTLGAYIDPMDAEDPTSLVNSVHDYEPGPGVRTYRVQIQGSFVRIGADGRSFSWTQSIQTPHLSSGPLRLKCSGVELQISSLRIVAL
jgi:hypothetical protein